ncbi:MAG: diapophytoene dehydrogenase [Bacteroidetes bacterium MED-G17]|nr:MAG: diapophytoene dehydrogenase [Bacteroidetes bacterium MED-G17]
MAKTILIMPKMGESIAEATIIKWLKSEGDRIEIDEAVLEIATDKVDSEVPSPSEGVLGKIFFQEGDVVEVGAQIAEILTENAEIIEDSTEISNNKIEIVANEIEKQVETIVEDKPTAPLVSSTSNRFYSPLVLNISKTEGISLNELASIVGSGKDGRVTKKDMLTYVKSKNRQPQKNETSPNLQKPSSISVKTNAEGVFVNNGDEIIEMDRMRKLIAEHMVNSKKTSPHVTSFVEADVTNIVQWRNRVKRDFHQREGEKITFTPIFIEAVAQAIKEFPLINISVEEDKIIKKGNINIGMATALPSGNLIVPVIKNADQLNLLGITKKVNDLANRARMNQLKPEEIQGGTYTITNVGTFGNIMGTPIINQPQVAILAFGAIKKKPAVIETTDGDFIGVRHMMYLSHSYDHRVVDGALGGQFVRKVADILEAWDLNRSV